ncbi:MAG TPA: hypothetical protein VGQ99_01610 [Tepidisphaeraceae bacterium]|jgi:hypothetical protein|nr:hypothetical protein [Tepidisphaeraceae bacterium]
MDMIKKNMWSIVCGVVAVLAVAATYYPLSGKFVELNGKLQASADDQRKLKQLNQLNPNMPVVDPKKSEPLKLNQFPTEKVIAKGKEVVGKVHTESEKLQQKAMEMNKREPLVVNALPAGRGRYLSDFKEEYYRGMEQMRKDLDATTIPSEEDIKNKIEQVWVDNYKSMIRMVGDVPQNEAEVRQEFDEFKKTIPRDMRAARAQQHVMYVSPDKAGANPGVASGMTTSFDYHPGIPAPERGDLPDIVDVWAAQLGYWIQEDVVKAIIETNKGAKTVDDAVVKRLFKTEIRKEYITKTGPVLISMASNPQNLVVPRDQQGTDSEAGTGAPKVFGYSATGRVCNPNYDVMHFVVIVDADAQRFQTFMTNLTRGRFITILRADVRGVDRERMQQNSFYYYGKQPVARVTLKCEAIFMRSWTVDPQHPLMPVNVQKLLRIPQTPTGVAEAR